MTRRILNALRRRPDLVPDPGFRAPNDLLEHLATLKAELAIETALRTKLGKLYGDAAYERDQYRQALDHANAELAELRHLPEQVRRLLGSLDLARARNTDLARDLRQAREHLDQCPNSTTPEASTP